MKKKKPYPYKPQKLVLVVEEVFGENEWTARFELNGIEYIAHFKGVWPADKLNLLREGTVFTFPGRRDTYLHVVDRGGPSKSQVKKWLKEARKLFEHLELNTPLPTEG